jgi:hypothetical protein
MHLAMADLRFKLSLFVIAGLTRNPPIQKIIKRLRIKPSMTFSIVMRQFQTTYKTRPFKYSPSG